MARKSPTPLECPVCGEEVPPNAKACPECGADHNSGWQEEADSGGLGLPDDNFCYEEWVREEFGNSPKPAAIKPLWWIVALILVISLAGVYFLAAWK